MTDHASGSGGKPENRRDFLYLSTGLFAGAGTALALWPFIHSMNPSADVLALSTTEVDISSIEVESAPGEGATFRVHLPRPAPAVEAVAGDA